MQETVRLDFYKQRGKGKIDYDSQSKENLTGRVDSQGTESRSKDIDFAAGGAGA